MAEDDARQQAPEANSALGSLDVMVGTWDLKGRESGPHGEIHGRVTFEWMGGWIKDVEYTGYDESNEVFESYFFSSTRPGPFGGVALEYVCEVGDGTLTICGG